MTKKTLIKFDSWLNSLKLCLKFLLQPNSQNAELLCISLAGWMDEYELSEMADYFDQSHSLRIRMKKMDNRPLIIREGLYHDVDPADVVMRNQDLLRNASNIGAASNKQHENFTSSDFYFEKVTKPSEVYRYSTSNETGLPTSGEMVYYPRPTHPLEEENQRLKEENDSLREEIATLRKRHGYKETKK